MRNTIDYPEILQAAEFHWHFEQAEAALKAELYIPAAITFLTAIENSIRSTLTQVRTLDFDANQDLGTTLSNRLIREAADAGMPVNELSLRGEDILDGIRQNRPNVGLVSLRHDLCHGNIQNYIVTELGVFTPECLREVSAEIQSLAERWVVALAEFRRAALRNA